jgi:cyclic dehypoxanthinyl futalosine synthase
MSLTKQQALEMFESDDLIGIGMEADAVRRKLHPEGTVTYIIDRNINYTNFCTEYCTFCAFYRPLKGPAAKEGYILDFDTIYEKIRETVELGGTGVLMQGGLHPDLKIDWHEKMLRGIKQRFPQVHLHCYSASEIIAIAEYSSLSIRDTILRLRDAGLDSIPGGGAEILDDEVRYKIARLKCLTNDWINVHRTAHQIGMRTTATMMFGVGENYENRVNHFQQIYDLQEETGGFTAFIPWSFQPHNTALGGRHWDEATAVEYLKTLAISRLYLSKIELGNARPESLPDGPALRRQRRRLGDARRKRSESRRRDQLHDRRRVAPHHPRRRLQARPERHSLSAVLPELRWLKPSIKRKSNGIVSSCNHWPISGIVRPSP